MDEVTPTPKKGMSSCVKCLIGCVIFLVLLVLCFVIASVLGIAGISKVAEEINIQIEESENEEQQVFDNPMNVGDVVTTKDVQWTLVEAKKLGTILKSKYKGYSDCVANSGQFIQVEIKIKNNGKDMVTVTDLNVYDSEKREYTASSELAACVDREQYVGGDVNPGIEKTFVGIYEVPVDASGFRVKVSDLNLFSTSHKYISLGF